MMGIFAPVVTDVCRTSPWTGLFSGEDLSIPGGVKPKRTHNSNTLYISSEATNQHISSINPRTVADPLLAAKAKRC